MQTFMPYSDFRAVAKCLDYQRLGKQRVEAKQILKALHDSNYGWANHPMVAKWRGYEYALMAYMNAMIVEWVDRGYKNRMPIIYLNGSSEVLMDPDVMYKPNWVLSPESQLSYRRLLLDKNLDYYKSIFLPMGV